MLLVLLNDWLTGWFIDWLIDWLNWDNMTDQTNGWRNGEFDMKYTILKVRSELEKVIAELIFLYWFSCRISECSRWSSVMSVAYQTLYEIKRKRKPRSYDMGKRDLEYPKLATCSSHESPIAQEFLVLSFEGEKTRNVNVSVSSLSHQTSLFKSLGNICNSKISFKSFLSSLACFLSM